MTCQPENLLISVWAALLCLMVCTKATWGLLSEARSSTRRHLFLYSFGVWFSFPDKKIKWVERIVLLFCCTDMTADYFSEGMHRGFVVVAWWCAGLVFAHRERTVISPCAVLDIDEVHTTRHRQVLLHQEQKLNDSQAQSSSDTSTICTCTYIHVVCWLGHHMRVWSVFRRVSIHSQMYPTPTSIPQKINENERIPTKNGMSFQWTGRIWNDMYVSVCFVWIFSCSIPGHTSQRHLHDKQYT